MRALTTQILAAAVLLAAASASSAGTYRDASGFQCQYPESWKMVKRVDNRGAKGVLLRPTGTTGEVYMIVRTIFSPQTLTIEQADKFFDAVAQGTNPDLRRIYGKLKESAGGMSGLLLYQSDDGMREYFYVRTVAGNLAFVAGYGKSRTVHARHATMKSMADSMSKARSMTPSRQPSIPSLQPSPSSLQPAGLPGDLNNGPSFNAPDNNPGGFQPAASPQLSGLWVSTKKMADGSGTLTMIYLFNADGGMRMRMLKKDTAGQVTSRQDYPGRYTLGGDRLTIRFDDGSSLSGTLNFFNYQGRKAAKLTLSDGRVIYLLRASDLNS